MKKIIILLSIFASVLISSCEMHVLEYDAKTVGENTAGIKIFNDVNTNSSSTVNSITQLRYNGELYSNISTTLGTAIPNSSAKFHNVPVGPLKIDLFRTLDNTLLNVYSKSVNIEKGNWAAFVYDLEKDPAMFKVPDTWPTHIMENGAVQDTICLINFVNLFYKPDGETPFGPITLYVSRKINGEYVDWELVGTADFGQETGFKPIRLYRKGISIWSGTESNVDIALLDKDGNYVKRFTSTTQTSPIDYIGTGYALAKGRPYYFHLNGRQGDSYNTQVIRMSTHAVK